ncbi:hypothetical protein ARMSODRAFT_980652, partial [Armillaria solidipes]
MTLLASTVSYLKRIIPGTMRTDDRSFPDPTAEAQDLHTRRDSGLCCETDHELKIGDTKNPEHSREKSIETTANDVGELHLVASKDSQPYHAIKKGTDEQKYDYEQRAHADREMLKQATRAKGKAEKQRDEVLRELDQLQTHLELQASEIASFQNYTSSLEQARLCDMTEMENLRKHCQNLEHQLHATHAVLIQEREQRQMDRRLLATRAQELHDTETFLTKADLFSGAEVKVMVQGLNSEILQLAADIVDTLQFEENAMEVDGGDQRPTEQCLAIDARMKQLLEAGGDPDTHAIIVQAALQGVITRLCRRFISEWSKQSSTDDDLYDLYRDIRKKYADSPAVAGRWRSMTREKSKYSVVTETEENFYSRVLEVVLNVLRIAGWSPADAMGTLIQTFGKRVSAIVKAAMKLDRAMGEGITSQDL